MESNIIKIFIKKFWKRCVTLPLNSLQRGMTLPFWHSLSLMTLPSEAPALPPPPSSKKKRTSSSLLSRAFSYLRMRFQTINVHFMKQSLSRISLTQNDYCTTECLGTLFYQHPSLTIILNY